MRINSEIKKWGNSLALRITGIMAELLQFRAGSKVTVEVTQDGFVIKSYKKQKRRLKLPYSENDLLKDMTPSKAHADNLAVPIASEVGK